MSHPFRVLAIAVALGTAGVSGYAAPAGYVGSSQQFSVTKTTEIPGGSLRAGDYTIQILDQLSDRMLVRIDSTSGKEHSLFLAVPHAAFADASGGPADWNKGAEGGTALRGFAFSNGSAVEFVYPKAEAAAIATKNAAKVVAIDPESEGRPKLDKMSQDDMKVVTLWMLTLTTAAPNSKTPALLAQRYESDVNPSAIQVAQNDAPPQPPAAHPGRERQTQQASGMPSEGSAAAVPMHHAVKQLPHTASNLPLIWLAGLFSLLAASLVRMGRMMLGTAR